MAKGRSSLAAQLAELGGNAPNGFNDELDSDPEALDAGRRARRDGSDESDDEDEEDRARSHARHNVVEVAPSKMRRQTNFIEAIDDDDDAALTKYKGVKTTRKEMLEDDDEDNVMSDDDEDGSDLQSVSEEEGSSYGSDDVEEDDEGEEDEEEDEQRTAPPAKKTLRFAKDVDEPNPVNGSQSHAKAAQADTALLAELRQRSRQDAQRGRDARRQIDGWAKLLGVRIRAQKVVRASGRIAAPAMAAVVHELPEEEKKSYEATLASLDQLSAHLFSVQDRLLRSYASSSAENDAIPTRLDALETDLDAIKSRSSLKRKLDDDAFDQQLSILSNLHAGVFGPMWREVLAKWSWRTSTTTVDDMRKAKSRFDGAISGSGGAASSGLKAVNQSAEEQIERGLTGDAFERLRKRTRVWRGTEKEARIGVDVVVGGDGREEDEDDEIGEQQNDGQNADVFDDSDFYAALLRELIDSKGGSGLAGTTDADGSAAAASAVWAQAAKRAAKKHRAVDRKASKGRRLRYDVHEKVENFMPAIPTETWSSEQVQRLISQLRSAHGLEDKSAPAEEGDSPAKADEVVATPADVQLGGLRLFG